MLVEILASSVSNWQFSLLPKILNLHKMIFDIFVAVIIAILHLDVICIYSVK